MTGHIKEVIIVYIAYPITRKYLETLIDAGAVGKENAVTLESVNLKKLPFLNFLIKGNTVGVDGNKYYVTEQYAKSK